MGRECVQLDRYNHVREQDTHHVLHSNEQRNDFFVIVATPLLQGVRRLERQDNNYVPVYFVSTDII